MLINAFKWSVHLMSLMSNGLFLMAMRGVSDRCFPFDGRTLIRKRFLAEICLDVTDIAVYVLIAAINPIQLLLEVLVDEFVAVEQLV